MGTKYLIEGGTALKGEVRIQAAKNAVLPILAASLMSEGQIILHNCPKLLDIDNMLGILRLLNVDAQQNGKQIRLCAANASGTEVNKDLARQMRSSVFLLGPLLARFKKAVVSEPGGCNIGARPIDQHIKGLELLGARVVRREGIIECFGEDMHSANITLDMPSVGATENIIMAAALLDGISVLKNAAQEPEIVDLASFLNALGCKISGAGTSTILIEGVKRLSTASIDWSPISDRIVAGTFLMAAAACSGDVVVQNAISAHNKKAIQFLLRGGCTIIEGKDYVRIIARQRFCNPAMLRTAPYSGFPTDLQAQSMALMSIGMGKSCIVERLFENRFAHAQSLNEMGANIVVHGKIAVVSGVERLHGACVNARDLRGGAALVIAGMAAQGVTAVNGIHHIERGYQSLHTQLAGLGAKIELI